MFLRKLRSLGTETLAEGWAREEEIGGHDASLLILDSLQIPEVSLWK